MKCFQSSRLYYGKIGLQVKILISFERLAIHRRLKINLLNIFMCKIQINSPMLLATRRNLAFLCNTNIFLNISRTNLIVL